MKRADRRLIAELPLRTCENLADVLRDPRPVVLLRIVQRIFAVVANVEHHQLEIIDQWLPERRISIDRKPVAMAQQQAHRAAPVAAQANRRAVGHPQINDGVG